MKKNCPATQAASATAFARRALPATAIGTLTVYMKAGAQKPGKKEV